MFTNGLENKISGKTRDTLISLLFTRVALSLDAYHPSLSH